MLYIVVNPRWHPVERQINLLYNTLTMSGIEYTVTTVENVPPGATVITDCFLMETPIGDPGHDIANKLIEHACKNHNRLIFYYPSDLKKKCTSGVVKPFFLSCLRKRLTRKTS